MKSSLTPEEKLRAAHAHLINEIDQHHIASLFGVNSGRVAEAVKAVREAVGWPKPKTRRSANEYDPDLEEADYEGDARALCFRRCSAGEFLDFENGCVSVCASADDCKGWRPLISEAKRLDTRER